MVRRAGRRRGAAAGQGIALAVADRVRRRDRAGADRAVPFPPFGGRSEEHTSELQSLMRISYAVFCLKKKKNTTKRQTHTRMNKQRIASMHNTYQPRTVK